MKTRITLLIASVVMLARIAGAQDPQPQADPHLALAEQLLVAMDVPETVERSFDMFKKMIPMQIKKMYDATEGPGAANDPAAAERLKKVTDKAVAMMTEQLSWAQLKDEYVSVYAKTFTDEEMNGAIAFYQSPVGKSFIKKQPEMMKQSMEASQKRVYKLIAEIQALCKEDLEGGDKAEKAEQGDVPVLKSSPLKSAPAKNGDQPKAEN